MLVAVYGTLKKGFGNHRIIEHCKYIGSDLLEKFDLYDLGPFPGIYKGDNKVFVELYKVTDTDTEKALDCLEGYPVLYDKSTVFTNFGPATIYIYNRVLNEGESLLKDGFWK